MPGSDYQQISEQLIAAGLKGETACAIVSRASSQAEHIHRTTVKNLASAPLLPAPTLLLVGEVLTTPDAVQFQVEAAVNVLPTVPDAFSNDQVFLGD